MGLSASLAPPYHHISCAECKRRVGNVVLTAEFTGKNLGFSLAENTDELFVENYLFMGDSSFGL